MSNQQIQYASQIDPYILRLLNSIAIPVTEITVEIVASLSENAVFHLDRLITDEVAKDIWIRWVPNGMERLSDPKFHTGFKNLLKEAVSMGLNVNRLQNIARNLPDPDDGYLNWIPLYEGAILGREYSNIRLTFNSSDYSSYSSSQVDDNGESEENFSSMFSKMSEGLFYELGIILPQFNVVEDDSLGSYDYQVEWNDLRLPPQRAIRDDQVLVNDTPDRLTLLNILDAEAAVNPANSSQCAIVDIHYKDLCEQAGLTTWTRHGYIILQFSSVIRRSAGAYINRYFVEHIIDKLEKMYSHLIHEIRENLDIDILVQILRNLVREEITIRDMWTILQAILLVQSTLSVDFSKYIVFTHNASSALLLRQKKQLDQLTPSDYVAHIRAALKNYISHKYTRGQSTLIVYLIDPNIETQFRQSGELSIEEKEAFLYAVRDEIESLPPSAQTPVILTTLEVRQHMRMVLHHEFPNLVVLAYQELSPSMNIQPIARITNSP